MPGPDAPTSPADLIKALPESLPDRRVTIGELLGILHAHGLAAVLLILASLQMLPVPNVIWSPLSTLVALVCFGQATRIGYLIGPKWLLQRSVPRRAVVRACRYVLPWLRRLETVVRPRFMHPRGDYESRLLASVSGLLAALLALPLPVLNWLPAIALLVLSLGWLERDGLVLLVGLIASAVALTAYAVFAVWLIGLGGNI